MIPITIVLVPVYLVITKLGLVNSLWAVILPGTLRLSFCLDVLR